MVALKATRLIVASRAVSVLEKIDPYTASGRWLRFRYAPSLKDLLMSEKLCGAEAGECDEIADEVRLVEESTVQGEATPIWRRGPSRQCEDPLKPLHSVEQLWCETDLGLEDLAEPPLAQTNTLADVADGGGIGSAERVEGKAHRTVTYDGTRQTREERGFQDAELVDRSGRGPEPVAKLAS